jgi:hypothetical protein
METERNRGNENMMADRMLLNSRKIDMYIYVMPSALNSYLMRSRK